MRLKLSNEKIKITNSPRYFHSSHGHGSFEVHIIKRPIWYVRVYIAEEKVLKISIKGRRKAQWAERKSS